MITFHNRILFVGFGAVARCTLPILLDHVRVDPTRITILFAGEQAERIASLHELRGSDYQLQADPWHFKNFLLTDGD